MDKLVGSFQKQIYYNDQNNYLIGLFKVRKSNNKAYLHKTITITGYIPPLNMDEDYELEGEFANHPRYGEQFVIKQYNIMMPDNKEGVIAFLSSDLFKGIGVNTATKIVDALGIDAINLIIKNPKLLKQTGISDKHQITINETLKNYQHSHQYIVKLTELDFKLNDAILIYNTFKNNIDDVLNNLYEVCLTLNLSFTKINTIINKHHLTYKEDTYYMVYMLSVINKVILNTGDTYLLINSLHNLIRHLDETIFNQTIGLLVKHKHIVVLDDKIWPYELYYDELCISDFFKLAYHQNIKIPDVKHQHLNHLQIDAINNAFKYNHSIITGGPGTGKTTIIKHIVELYQRAHPKAHEGDLVLLAPTGKASKRMTLSANYPATTIHRFLKWDKDNDTFAVNVNNQSNAKMIIIDEVSMVDTNLMASLIRGINPKTKLVIVGDYYQLPSIRPGQLLKDLIDSDMIPTVKLTHIYRQSKGSIINVLSNAIIEHDQNTITSINDQNTISYLDINNIEIKNYLLTEISNLLKSYTINDIAVLIPKYATEVGIDQINMHISNYLLPSAKQIKYGDSIFKAKDKILLLNNMPDLNIFNGDIGYIKDIYDKSFTASFDDNLHEFKISELNAFKLGYATSIHKAQGSEYKVVFIIVNKHFAHMLDQQLIYTAITRAKEKVYIIGDTHLFFESLETNIRRERITFLKTLLTA